MGFYIFKCLSWDLVSLKSLEICQNSSLKLLEILTLKKCVNPEREYIDNWTDFLWENKISE